MHGVERNRAVAENRPLNSKCDEGQGPEELLTARREALQRPAPPSFAEVH